LATPSAGAASERTLKQNDNLSTLNPDNFSIFVFPGDAVSFVNSNAANVISLNSFITQSGWATGDVYGPLVNNFVLGNFGNYFAGDGRSLTVTGGSGDDSIWLHTAAGKTGSAFGGAGNDLFVSWAGAETFDGGSEGFQGDTVGFNASTSGVVASLADQSINTGDAAGDIYISIEVLMGSIYNDTLYSVSDGKVHQLIGDPGILDGIGGNDTLYGATGTNAGYTNFIPGAGIDTMYLGDGGNQIDYETAKFGLFVSLTNMALNTGDAAGDVMINAAGKNIDVTGSLYADTLYGDAGSNNIIGDPYDDPLYGAVGGNDQIFGMGGDDILTGGLGADTLDGGTGFNYASYSQSRAGLTVALATPSNNTGEASGDVYINIQGIFGSLFGDILRGDAGNNILVALSGNDQLFGGEGDDLLNGGAGADTLDGGAGGDTAHYGDSPIGLTIDMNNPANSTGEAAGDILVAGTIEAIVGSKFNDAIFGDGSATFLNGSLGNDTIHGGGGNDGITGGMGADLLYGDAGADHFAYFAVGESAGGDIDTIADFATGQDSLGLSLIPPQNLTLTRTLNGGTTLTASILGAAFQINILTNIGGVDIRGLASGITVNGSANGETLIGSIFGDTFDGGAGADTIITSDGIDILRYTAASQSAPGAADLITDFKTDVDKLDFSTMPLSNVKFQKLAGVIEVSATTGNGTILVKSAQTIFASDVLGITAGITAIGDDGPETLKGTRFADTIQGNGGSDALFGGLGADIFVYTKTSDSTSGSSDILQDFVSGVDRIDLAAVGLSNGTAQPIALVRDAGGTTLFANTSTGSMVIGALSDINGDDIIGLTKGVYIIGAGAAEQLRGTAFADLFDGNGGADTITGGAGADIFRYFLASDSTPAARDVITDFQTGSDSLDFGALNATAITVTRGSTTTTITATTAAGALAIDLTGLVNGSDIIGAACGITLIGNPTSAALSGTPYNDTLIGGDGQDTLTGGGNADTFRFTTRSQSPSTAPDSITDFQMGIDKLDLTEMAATGVVLTKIGALTQLTGTTPQGAFQINATGTVLGTDILGLTSGILAIGSASGEMMKGTPFNDTLQGGGGADALFGGQGADIFRYAAASDSPQGDVDILQDFATGTDKLDLTAIGLSAPGAQQLSLVRSGGGTTVFATTTGGTFSLGLTTALNGDDIIGNTKGVYLVGDGTAEQLRGTAFADLFDGNGGADTMSGGAGADIWRYFAPSDSTNAAPDLILDFQAGVDRFDLGALSPTSVILDRNGGSTITVGSNAGTTVFKTATAVNPTDFISYFGPVQVTGTGFLIGSEFADNMVGGGENTLIRGGAGNDTIDGGAGTDTAAYSGAQAQYRFGQRDGSVVVSGPDGADVLTNVEYLKFGDAAPVAITTLQGQGLFEEAVLLATNGLNGYVLPDAYSGPVPGLQYQVLGTASNDVALGTSKNDFFNLLGGDDAVNGGAGNDVIDGGIGSNFLSGGAGIDTFFLDGRGGTSTWSTITDWQAGEQLSVFGWKPGISRVLWLDNDGTAGFRGVTMHADLDGNGLFDTSVTWSGKARADLPVPFEFSNPELLWFIG